MIDGLPGFEAGDKINKRKGFSPTSE